MKRKNFIIIWLDGYLLNWKTRREDRDISDWKAYKPINNASVKLHLNTDSLQFSASYDADKDGWFSFVLDNDIYGKQPMTLTVRDLKKNKTVKDGIPVLQRWISPDIEPYSYYETHYHFENYAVGVNQTDSVFENEITGKAEVSFYNNSTCKNICISAEGITKDGIPVVYEKK